MAVGVCDQVSMLMFPPDTFPLPFKFGYTKIHRPSKNYKKIIVSNISQYDQILKFTRSKSTREKAFSNLQ